MAGTAHLLSAVVGWAVTEAVAAVRHATCSCTPSKRAIEADPMA